MRRRHRTPQVVSFALLLSLLLSLLCLRACLAQDVPDATAPATIAHDIEGAPPLDDPEGEFEKKDAPPIVPCDDGIGPDPNRMPPALPPPPEGEKSGDGAGGESGSGVASLLHRVITHAVSKFQNIDMQTGRPFEKPKRLRIPMCPDAKPRRPVPGVDCELPTPEEKLECCDCGCGCCSMLRRVAKRTVNKFRHINMETGKPFKALPSCDGLMDASPPLPSKRDDLPLKRLLAEKIAKGKNTKKGDTGAG
jgi:hypothetical protein